MDTKRDKRNTKGINSRKLIINAAINCIATQGLCRSTLDKIAITANVSRALVIFHFKTKKGMLSAVLKEISTLYFASWDKIVNEKELSTSAKLLKLIIYDIRLPIEEPELIAVWHAFWGEAKGLYKELDHSQDVRYAADIQVLITQLVNEGKYKNVDPDIACSTLIAILYGLWWKAHLSMSPNYYEQCMAVINSFLSMTFPKHY